MSTQVLDGLAIVRVFAEHARRHGADIDAGALGIVADVVRHRLATLIGEVDQLAAALDGDRS